MFCNERMELFSKSLRLFVCCVSNKKGSSIAVHYLSRLSTLWKFATIWHLSLSFSGFEGILFEPLLLWQPFSEKFPFQIFAEQQPRANQTLSCDTTIFYSDICPLSQSKCVLPIGVCSQKPWRRRRRKKALPVNVVVWVVISELPHSPLLKCFCLHGRLKPN